MAVQIINKIAKYIASYFTDHDYHCYFGHIYKNNIDNSKNSATRNSAVDASPPINTSRPIDKMNRDYLITAAGHISVFDNKSYKGKLLGHHRPRHHRRQGPTQHQISPFPCLWGTSYVKPGRLCSLASGWVHLCAWAGEACVGQAPPTPQTSLT